MNKFRLESFNKYLYQTFYKLDNIFKIFWFYFKFSTLFSIFSISFFLFNVHSYTFLHPKKLVNEMRTKTTKYTNG